jgi:hypothetical protein
MIGHVDTSSRRGHVSIRIIRYIADEMELEFTVNTGSSDESDDLEWELETGDVSTENDILTDYVGR